MSSINDSLTKMISDSQEVARELRWFMTALPAMCATEVMGSPVPGSSEDVQALTIRREYTRALLGNDAGMITSVLSHVPAASYYAAEQAIAEFGKTLLTHDNLFLKQKLVAIDQIDEAKQLLDCRGAVFSEAGY